MVTKKMATIVVMFVCSSFLQGMAIGGNPETSEKEKGEYKQERTRIETLRKSFTPGPTNDLKEYEKFADGIQSKWSRRNKELNARLMMEICGPLSSGDFKDDRRHEIARKYALSALENPNAIPLTLELDLTGHVITLMIGPNVPKEEDFAKCRKKDVEVRLHAWKRLIGEIDPNWNPNDMPVSNVAPPTATGLPGGVAPEAIKDATLRAEYETAIKRNRQKAERYGEQYELRKWLKWFPKRAERYIIRAYSKPPFNLAELKQYLDDYMIDEKTKTRILDTVTKNIEKQTEEKPEGSEEQNQ